MSPITVPSVQICAKNTHILISFPFISSLNTLLTLKNKLKRLFLHHQPPYQTVSAAITSNNAVI